MGAERVALGAGRTGDSGRGRGAGPGEHAVHRARGRSEEHTSELQSPCNLVCRLLLEKKKTNPLTHARYTDSSSSSALYEFRLRRIHTHLSLRLTPSHVKWVLCIRSFAGCYDAGTPAR